MSNTSQPSPLQTPGTSSGYETMIFEKAHTIEATSPHSHETYPVPTEQSTSVRTVNRGTIPLTLVGSERTITTPTAVEVAVAQKADHVASVVIEHLRRPAVTQRLAEQGLRSAA